jgi:hypothetical protein
VTPKAHFCALQSTHEFQITALMRSRRSGAFGRDFTNQFHDATALGTVHDTRLWLVGRFRVGSVGWFCRDKIDIQQFFDFLQTLAMRGRQKTEQFFQRTAKPSMNFMIGKLQRLSFDQTSSSASPPLKLVLREFLDR